MKITVSTNVSFKKIKGKKLPKLIFDNLIKPIGRGALQKVKKSFKSGIDINGKSYPDYKDKEYEAYRKSLGKNTKMVFTGNLKSSIQTKIFTNEATNTVIIRPDYNKASRDGKFYGAFHASGDTRDGVMRKWFYNEDDLIEGKDELPFILSSDEMLGKQFKKGMKALEQKIQSQLKVKMRKLSSKTFEI